MCLITSNHILWYFLKSPIATTVKLTKLRISNYFRKKRLTSKFFSSNAQSMVDEDILNPPEEVRGMKVLDRKLFSKTINVPWIVFPVASYPKCMKKYMLKLENLKPMQELEVNNEDCSDESKKLFKKLFLNPVIVKSFEDISESDRVFLETLGINKCSFNFGPVHLTYNNWRADEVLKSVLPLDVGNLTSYSKIGHIVHVNLKENMLEYKTIIGQVLLDKVSGARTVVNKVDAIDNTFRNFQMELLSGENDMKAQVRENRCVFEFDFSSVYWNPRLCTEHERILSLLSPGDVLFDVFAGVGPFSIPASRHRHCSLVMANDLNPESHRWLVHNAVLNKVSKDKFKAFNKDGWSFIVEDISLAVQQRWEKTLEENNDIKSKMHIVMNLPGRAAEFLGAFCGVFSGKKHLSKIAEQDLLTVHVYCFVPAENSKSKAVDLVESNLGHKLVSKELAFVRKVSPNKDMLRVTFELPKEVLFKNIGEQHPQPPPKRICLERTGEKPGCILSYPENKAYHSLFSWKLTELSYYLHRASVIQ